MFKDSQKGVSIYLVLVIMFILLAIGLGISLIIVSQMRMIRGMGDSVVAFHAADTGIEHSLYNYRIEGESGRVSGSFGPGYGYEVTHEIGSNVWKSKGSFKLVKRAIEITSPSGPIDFYIEVNPTSGSVAPGNGIQTTVTAHLISGTPEPVFFSALESPSEPTITYQWVDSEGNPSNNCIPDPSCSRYLRIITESTTPEQTYTITITGTAGAATDTAEYTLTVVTGGGCFLAGTKITMADGSYKNIEDVKVGDLVRYFDFKERKIKETGITKVNIHPPEEMGYDYYLVLNNKLRITPNHPLNKPDGKVIFAGELKIGDKLQGEGGEVEIFSIEKVYNIVTTYSLETESRYYFIDGIADIGKW